jgi:hypothetical protein
MKFKRLILFIFVLFFLLGCQKEKEMIVELPADISKVEPVENIVDTLVAVLPEEGNALVTSPELFSDTIQKKIVLIKESKVFVTFIDEAAEYKNSLCWYSYNKLQPPSNVADIKGNVVFPNISKIGEGGLLEAGYTVELGNESFPAGTVIGFFLVADGWKDGTIEYSNPTYYTDSNLNNGGEQRHILFKDRYSRYLVVGFEDYFIGAMDFNDIFFAVSDNNEGYEATAFDLSKVIVK